MIRQFCFALLFSLIAFWVIFLVVDLVEHVDKYYDKQASVFSVIRYYLYFTPYILVLALPVAMLLSCLFSLGQLAKHNELTAMKSVGISLYRMLLPVYILSFLISVFAMGFGETVVPLTSQRKEEIETVEIEKGRRETNLLLNNVFVQGEDGRIFHVATYDTKEGIGSDALVQRFDENRLKEEIRAKRVRWQSGGWLFEEGVERVFSAGQEEHRAPDKSERTELDSLSSRAVREDQVGAEQYRSFERLFRLDLKIEPEALARRQKKPEEMGYFELARYVKGRKRVGAQVSTELTDLNAKIAYPFISFLIILFGGPIAVNPRRSGMAVSAAITLFIAFCSYIVIKGTLILGYKAILSPFLAAWSANILFAVLGIILLVKARK